MNHCSKITRYLERYGVPQNRPLRTLSREGIERVVVIPALAESASLFGTLAGIAANPPRELDGTLVLCVVNNHPPPLTDPELIRDNHRTLAILADLLAGVVTPSAPEEIRDDLRKIAGSALRLGWIDASSPGSEIPEGDGGVGMARKIGMDAALMLLGKERTGLDGRIMVCLDADTLVEENYLAAVRNHFAAAKDCAAVARYAHRMPSDPGLAAAICGYEIFLRAYVIGLSFAGSPYAFHSIGSTMACTAQAYVDVRGMNRRKAAEDFHFLNKLAKIGCVGVIGATTVFPSPRESARVPFGTGRSMMRFMSGEAREYRLHDSRIFMILRQWLDQMHGDPGRGAEDILCAARKIHPRLEEYLNLNRFNDAWRDIRRNASDERQLRRQFTVWFDGLKTLRLLHHLSRTAFPPVSLLPGLQDLLGRVGRPIPSLSGSPGEGQEPKAPLLILEELRCRFPES